MRKRLVLLALLIASPAWAQPRPADPDWPCQQLLVPKLAAGSYWGGSIVPQAPPNWRDDDALSALITGVVDRDTPADAAQAQLRAYMKKVPADKRARTAAQLFGAIVDEANDERDQVVSHLDEISRRQQALSKTIDRINDEITKASGQQRLELTGQRDFNIQTFQDTQHTISYACAVPGDFDRRLGLLAQVLQE